MREYIGISRTATASRVMCESNKSMLVVAGDGFDCERGGFDGDTYQAMYIKKRHVEIASGPVC